MHGKLKTRLYVEAALGAGTIIPIKDAQAHFLLHTLRMKEGESLAVFNGADGEWRASVAHAGKKAIELRVEERISAPKPVPNIWLVFAPVKNEKIDYTVKRAVELGVAGLIPVMTERTMVSRVNTERLRANIVEAAEQCGRTDVPHLQEPIPLPMLLGAWDAARTLLFCDESGKGENARNLLPQLPQGAYAVLIGPEGGFSPKEQEMICGLKFARGLTLGPRVLRAETAALAALANVMAWLGDWDEKPKFEA